MWCPNCGYEVPDSSSFCMNCGTDLRPFKAALSLSASASAASAPAAEAPAPVVEPAAEVPVAEPAVAPSPVVSVPLPEADPNVIPVPEPMPTPAPQPAPATGATNDAMRRARSFMALLDERGYRYDYLHETEGDNRDGMVALSFGGGSFSFASIRVYVDFDYNNAGKGDSIHIWSSGMVPFPPEKRLAALEAINQVAIKKRFVRYFLDRDGDLMADTDCWIGEDSAAERAFDELTAFVSVIDDTYVELQKVRWN